MPVCDGSVYGEICSQAQYPTKISQTTFYEDKVIWIKYDGNPLHPNYIDSTILQNDGTDRFAKSVEGFTESGLPIKENVALDSQRLFVKGLGFTIPESATILSTSVVWRWFNNTTYIDPDNPGYTIDITKVSVNGVIASYSGIFIPATSVFGSSWMGLSAPMSGGFGLDKTETGYIVDTDWKHETSGDIITLTPEFFNSPETIIAFDTHKTAGPGTGNYELSMYELGLVVEYTFYEPGVNTDNENLLKMSTC